MHSEALGAWTASQVTAIDAAAKSATVLELDWSGNEPATLADLGDVQPLRLTHHSWGGKVSPYNHGWLLPKSFTVIGSLPPLVTRPSHAYGPAWGRGEQLARQRHWDSGDREDWAAPYALTCTADELAAEHTHGVVQAGVKHLTVREISRLDCALLAAAFPDLDSDAEITPAIPKSFHGVISGFGPPLSCRSTETPTQGHVRISS